MHLASWAGRPYAEGVSLMFYRILLSDTFARRFDYMWWMESDVQVLRPSWLDKVYEEALFPAHFWIKGSMYRGDRWDGIPEQHPMQWELMRGYAYHINGEVPARMAQGLCFSLGAGGLGWVHSFTPFHSRRAGYPIFYVMCHNVGRTNYIWDEK